MSYEPNAHPVQILIIRHLLFVPSAGFADIQKGTDLTSDHFNFHIKKLIDEGYVEKAGTHYKLSRKGKEYGNRLDTDENQIEKQPKLSVALVVERHDGKVLQQERLKQPYYGFWGFPTGKVRWGETVSEAAARELLEETGLTADIREAGLYHKMDFNEETGELLEDKYFLIAHCTNPTGELIESDEGHRNAWFKPGEVLAKEKVFASIVEIAELARSEGYGFIEQQYYYLPQDY